MITTSLANVKSRLSAFVDDVQSTHQRVVITKHGEPAAVLIAVDDLESLEETLALLSDDRAMRSLRKAERDAGTGRTHALAEVKPRRRS